MWIIGVILLAAAGGLAYGYSTKKGRLDKLLSTQNSTVEFLESLGTSMAEGVGNGSLKYITDIKGRVLCDEPLKSELTLTDCIYYSMIGKRRFEEKYIEKDKDGKKERKTRTVNETVASNKRSVPFYLEDHTGRIRVEPDGAIFITEKIHSSFKPAEGGKSISFGSLSINVPMNEGDRRTIGYSFEEDAIVTGKDIFIHGEVVDKSGEICIVRPGGEDEFIISVKSEETLTRELESGKKIMIISSIVCAVLGIAALVMGIVK